MSITTDTQYGTSKPADQDTLVEDLKEVFIQKFRHCQRIEVVGIISYTTDGGSEKFIKIDFSTVMNSLIPSTTSTCDEETHPQRARHEHNGDIQDRDVDNTIDIRNNLEILKDSDSFKGDTSPANASPPLLPPLVIQNNRNLRGVNQYPNAINLDCAANTDIAECSTDVVDGGFIRRDRRKSRRPKRQIVDSMDRTGDSEADDAATEQEEVVSSSDFDTSPHAKVPRLTCYPNVVPYSTVGSTPSSVEFAETHVNYHSGMVNSNTDVRLIETVPATNMEPIRSVPQDYINKRVQISYRGSESQAPQITPTTKYTIATKTLGLNDLGELCNLLPLSNILGRTILSCSDTNSLTVKVASTPNGAQNSVTIPVPEYTNQLSSNQDGTTANNQGQSQNFFLNSNLAAAVAAALSVSTHSNVGTVSYSDQNTISGMSAMSTPSIALTGPSGELIGTIPIGSTIQQHGILPSVFGTTLATHSSNTVNAANTISVSVPVSSCANGGSNLATTLNWLRCASASADLPNHSTHNTQTHVPGSGPIQNTNSPVALLQSLAGQNSIHALNSTAGKLPSISVGPTLALIGTLGLNPVSSSSSSMSAPNENATTATTGSTSTTLLTTNMGLGTTNNNAALVAAALLRGLAGAKSANLEASEATYAETNATGVPGAVTLITNSQLSAGGMTATRPNLIATDGALSSLSNILSSKVTSASSGLTTTVSVCDSPSLYTSSLSRVGPNPQFLNGVNTAVTRGSIMLSYPRGQGEMNLLLTPSSQSLTATSLSSMTAVPTALSFQSILNSQPSSIALSSPVLLQTPLSTSSGTKMTTTLCTTSAVAPTLSTSSSFVRPIQSKSNSESKVPSDPTASAIDRILQTIKGCMNNENRENDVKHKLAPALQKRTESSNSVASSLKSNSDDIPGDSTVVSGSKRSYSVKLTPITLSMNKGVGVSESEELVKGSDSNKNSLVANERVPLAPLSKDSNDHENPHVCRVTKVYRCRYCGKTFNRKFCRERHERLHTGVKPYTCEICEEKFIRLEDKKRHVRSLQHYLAGRGSYMKSESGDIANEDNTTLGIDPSTVLPLLTHTLQGGNQESTNGNLSELDEPAGLSASEGTSNDQGSDCESFDVEETPEKVSTDFHQVDINRRVDTPDNCSDAPDIRHTPLSCEEDNVNDISTTDVQDSVVETQLALLISNEVPSLNATDSNKTLIRNNANVMSLSSVVLVNNEDIRASLPS